MEKGFGGFTGCGFGQFTPRVSRSTFKLSGFSGFEMCHRLLVWPYFVLEFRVFHSEFPFCRIFEVIQAILLILYGSHFEKIQTNYLSHFSFIYQSNSKTIYPF